MEFSQRSCYHTPSMWVGWWYSLGCWSWVIATSFCLRGDLPFGPDVLGVRRCGTTLSIRCSYS